MPAFALPTLAAIVASLAFAAPAAASFSVVPSPNKSTTYDVLNGVSASSPTDAWGVGTLCCFHYNGDDSLTEHWDGTGWHVIPSIALVRQDDVLNAVVDISPTNVWAVGYLRPFVSPTPAPMFVHYDGSSWGLLSPPGSSGVLRAISADSPNDIWAAGDDAHGHAIVYRYNGSTWSSVAIPAVGASDALQGIKAFGPSNVWAVGEEAPNAVSSQLQTLVLHWNGTTWSVVSSPSPDPSSDILRGVAGVSPTDLWAVGQQGQDETVTATPPGTRTLVEHWTGSRWSVVPSPNVANQDTLAAAAAVTGSSVAAVGSNEIASGSQLVRQTLAATWNGMSWSTDPSPDLSTNHNVLSGASTIPGTIDVWAVGYWTSARGAVQTLVLKGP